MREIGRGGGHMDKSVREHRRHEQGRAGGRPTDGFVPKRTKQQAGDMAMAARVKENRPSDTM
jgi:hypothetical protein